MNEFLIRRIVARAREELVAAGVNVNAVSVKDHEAFVRKELESGSITEEDIQNLLGNHRNA